MMRWLFYSIPFVLFLVIGLFLWRGLSLNPQTIPSPLIGKPMPSFHLPTLTTGEWVSGQHLLGKPFLVNVWASWCISCRAEHAYLMRLAKEIPIIGWNYKDDPQAAIQWVQRLGNPYRMVLVDQSGQAAINWGVYGTPETFLVDGEGIIRHKHVGPMTESVWRDQFLPLLNQFHSTQ